MGEQFAATVQEHGHPEQSDKMSSEAQHVEDSKSDRNLVYADVDEEPELHLRTWIALASMFFLNLVQVFALQGPPAVVGDPLLPPVLRLMETAVPYWRKSR